MASKGKCETIHFKQRVKDRIGILLTNKEVRELEKGVRCGRYPTIKRQSNRTSVVSVDFSHLTGLNGEAFFPCIYDKDRGRLVTILMPDWVGVGVDEE